MSKKRLTVEQYRGELIYRQIQISRYATGQANFVQSLVGKLNDEAAKFCLKKKRIETKKQYSDCKTFIRIKCLEHRDRLYYYLKKEMKNFAKEQSKWIYGYAPVKLKKVDTDKITRDIFFTAFTDTDTIRNYVTRVFNQILQIWNAQLTIAYKTGISMAEMIELVLDKEFS